MTERIWLYRDHFGDWWDGREREASRYRSGLKSGYALLGPITRRNGQPTRRFNTDRNSQYQVLKCSFAGWHVEVAFDKLAPAKAYLRMAIAQENRP